MKKKLALLLACSMALSLTACGGGSKPAETTAAPETTTAAASEAARKRARRTRQKPQQLRLRAGTWTPSSRQPRRKAN